MAETGEEKGGEQRFEAVLEELQTVVAKLEEGNLPLEEALAAFERGMTLADSADSMLTSAEERVEVLLKREGQTGARVPFEEAYPDVDLDPSGEG